MNTISIQELRGMVDRPEAASVSIYMPTQRVGRETQQNPIRFNNLLRHVERELIERGLLRAAEIADFLAPARSRSDDTTFWKRQQDGLATFIAPDYFRQISAPFAFEEFVAVARHFHIKPLLPFLSGDGRFYVLSLGRKAVQLYEGTRSGIDTVSIVGGPTEFLDVVGRDWEAKYVSWHSGSPATGGGRSGQFYGHGGGGGETVKVELREFALAVDRALAQSVDRHDAPLVLVGTEPLLPIFREATSWRHLADPDVRHNAADLTPAEIHERAWPIVEPLFSKACVDALDRFAELAGTGRTAERLPEILVAAIDGRVEVLFVARDLHRWGSWDPVARRVDVHPARSERDRDLADLAASEVLIRGGKTYLLASERVPGPEGVAAIFRY